MEQDHLAADVSGGSAITNADAPDVRLLSGWTLLASIFALAALWRVVHNCFQLCLLARTPRLGRLKMSEGRSPKVVAAHFTSVANAVVCIAAYFSAAGERLEGASWSPGALFPLWSRPLAVGPPMPGTLTFFLSLAAYCLHISLLEAERMADGVSGGRLVLYQRILLLLLAASVCMVDGVLELSLALFLLEVPGPFLALLQALQDFRLRSDSLYHVAGVIAVVLIALCRVCLFGLCLICIFLHPSRSEMLSGYWLPGQRPFTVILCLKLFVVYAVHFGRLCREVHRDHTAGKDKEGTH